MKRGIARCAVAAASDSRSCRQAGSSVLHRQASTLKLPAVLMDGVLCDGSEAVRATARLHMPGYLFTPSGHQLFCMAVGVELSVGQSLTHISADLASLFTLLSQHTDPKV
jgi:hypothetical protein